MIENDAWVTQAWSDHHGFLLDVGYRLLGSYSEAEDTVQEAFTRLLRTDLDPIEDVRAWLVVVVSRLCLGLRSIRRSSGGSSMRSSPPARAATSRLCFRCWILQSSDGPTSVGRWRLSTSRTSAARRSPSKS